MRRCAGTWGRDLERGVVGRRACCLVGVVSRLPPGRFCDFTVAVDEEVEGRISAAGAREGPVTDPLAVRLS